MFKQAHLQEPCNVGLVEKKGIYDINAINPEKWRARKSGIREYKSIKIIKQGRLHDS